MARTLTERMADHRRLLSEYHRAFKHSVQCPEHGVVEESLSSVKQSLIGVVREALGKLEATGQDECVKSVSYLYDTLDLAAVELRQLRQEQSTSCDVMLERR